MRDMLILITLVLAILVLIAWLVAINLFVEAAKEKGYYRDGGAGLLWFVGIFATPIVVGIYTTALPDKRSQEAHSGTGDASRSASIQDELPSV